MDEVTQIKALLSLVIAGGAATHTECIRAVSWLPSQESRFTTPDVPSAGIDTRSSTDQAPRNRLPEDAVLAIAITDDLSTWLSQLSTPVTNWFVMKGAAFDEHIAALEQHLQLTTNGPIPSHPGSYELGGLWRIRPGVNVSIYHPANFDPEDRISSVAVKVTLRDSARIVQVSGWSLASTLNKFLRQFIAGGEV